MNKNTIVQWKTRWGITGWAILAVLGACASGPASRDGGTAEGTYAMSMIGPTPTQANYHVDKTSNLSFSFLHDRYGFIVDIRNDGNRKAEIDWKSCNFTDPDGKVYPLFRVDKVGRLVDKGQTELRPNTVVSKYLGVYGRSIRTEEPDQLPGSPWVGMDPVGVYQLGKFESQPLWEGPMDGRKIKISLVVGSKNSPKEYVFDFQLRGDRWPAVTAPEAMRTMAMERGYNEEVFKLLDTRPEEKIRRYIRQLLEHSLEPTVRQSAATVIGHWEDRDDLVLLRRMRGIENIAEVRAAIVQAITQIENQDVQ